MATRRGRERKNTLNETPINYPKSRDSSDPLGSVTDGRLRFPSGASNVTVHTELSTADLYRAGFECPLPSVRVEGGAVAIECPWTLHPFDWRKRRCGASGEARPVAVGNVGRICRVRLGLLFAAARVHGALGAWLRTIVLSLI
jgi:hypothetical protein